MTEDKEFFDKYEERFVPDQGPTGAPPPVTKISSEDKAVLDSLRQKRDTAMLAAQLELSKSENAELSYKYVILQIYMKYHLSPNDTINENGEILYNSQQTTSNIGAVK
jgi:hypothetical protein